MLLYSMKAGLLALAFSPGALRMCSRLAIATAGEEEVACGQGWGHKAGVSKTEHSPDMCGVEGGLEGEDA